MNKEETKIKNNLSWIAIIMLLLATPSGLWPYSYYTILRWVITGIAIFIWSLISKLKNQNWSWITVGIAILFNPIIPIHLDKGSWVIIDFITAILFLILILKIKNNNEKTTFTNNP